MNNIFILDSQNDIVLGHINKQDILDNEHEQSLENMLSKFQMVCFAENRHAHLLGDRNGLIVPGEDDELLEFRIFESIKYRDGDGSLVYEVYARATFLDLKNVKKINPHKTSAESAVWHVNKALENTEWEIGNVDFKGVRSLDFDDYINPYVYLKRIAKEFELELIFYVKTDGNRVTGRYVDLIDKIGQFRGRRVDFRKDLQGIRRKEKTENIVTALYGIGPEQEDGTRLEVFVEDLDALERWGRKGNHIIDVYEPQSNRQNMTVSELRTYTQTELNKRINAIVTYEADIVDLENVPGLENKKIRFGDIIRIKDLHFNPPLYLEARIYNQKRNVFDKSVKTVELGDFVEYTEEEVKAIWKLLQKQIRQKISQYELENYVDNNAEKLIPTQPTPPDHNEYKKWVDTSVTPNQLKLYNETTKKWDAVKGEKGDQGVPGVQGPPGENGQSLYTWVKYANDKNGSDMSDLPDGKRYIGFSYNKPTPEESTNPADYQWAKIEGDQGVKGADGKIYYTWLKYADTPTTGMSDSPNGKKYMGLAYNKTTATESTNYADYQWSLIQGPQGPQGIPGQKGADGKSLYTWVKYADTATGGGMSDYPTNKKYIGLAYNKTTHIESTNPSDYEWAKIEGDQGVPGAKGADGKTTYTWVKYADDENGNGMSDSPVDKRYLGLAHNKTTATESNNRSDYMWSPLYDNVKPSNRNLLKDSYLNKTTSAYLISSVYLSDVKPSHNEEVTVSIKGNIHASKSYLGIYNSGGSVQMVRITNSDKGSDGVYRKTFKWLTENSSGTKANNTHVTLYHIPNSVTAPSTVEWIQIQKGNVSPRDWTPAPEDVEADAQKKANNARDQAKTDVAGGKVNLPTNKFQGPINAGQNNIRDSGGVNIVKNNGVLSTFVFTSSGELNGWQRCGYFEYGGLDGYFYAYIRFMIPPNFVIEDAVIYTYSCPVYMRNGWSSSLDKKYWHARYLNLYKVTSFSQQFYDYPLASAPWVVTRSSYQENISASVWGGRWDPHLITTGNYGNGYVREQSGSIIGHLNTGYNEFLVKSESAQKTQNKSLIQLMVVVKGYQN